EREIIVVDPIMADNGRLYSGIGADTVDRLRRMVSLADIALPNYTEACYLTETEFHSAGLQAGETRPLVDRMLAMGAKSVLVTSCRVGEQPCVIGFDAEQQQYMQIPYREVPVFFSGTGDIFSARLIATLLRGRSLQAAAVITMEKLSALIDTYQYEENKNEGIPY
ncbi:MAG: bifunctional hydroxymethylpyrimidine kinase/phosphomethylpyrimidine kinase, partial [Bacteroidaceae bacterium]|nr:bifunctional hydroxymethylpyrimidine kinase/phosphomethylpyrimidine kinase [Bacteroidaceae bacterium]